MPVEADALRAEAAHIERAGVRVIGDAANERQSRIDGCSVKVGDLVSSIYGVRRVIKVNRQSVGLESIAGLTVSKSLIKIVKSAA